MKINMIRIHDDAILPAYAHPGDSGMDLYSIKDIDISPGDTVKIRTGLRIAVPRGYEAQVRSKSGLALTHKISVADAPSTIDSGYRGEFFVMLRNGGTETYPVKKHQKIAQLVICPVLRAEIVEVEDLDNTQRGENGFGSTGLSYHGDTRTLNVPSGTNSGDWITDIVRRGFL